GTCPRCHRALDPRSARARVVGSSIRTYCSRSCVEAPELVRIAAPAKAPTGFPGVTTHMPLVVGTLVGALLLWPRHPEPRSVSVPLPHPTGSNREAAFEPASRAFADEGSASIELDTDDWVHP